MNFSRQLVTRDRKPFEITHSPRVLHSCVHSERGSKGRRKIIRERNGRCAPGEICNAESARCGLPPRRDRIRETAETFQRFRIGEFCFAFLICPVAICFAFALPFVSPSVESLCREIPSLRIPGRPFSFRENYPVEMASVYVYHVACKLIDIIYDNAKIKFITTVDTAHMKYGEIPVRCMCSCKRNGTIKRNERATTT